MDNGIKEDCLKCCDICGNPTEKIIEIPRFDGTGAMQSIKVGILCKCQKEKMDATERRMKHEEEQRRIDELKRFSLMDAKLRDVSFSTYKSSDENQKVMKIAKNYVENFDVMFQKNQGLLFWGGVGTGKSYTAAAIANELLVRQQSVIMTSFVKILEDMKGFDVDEGDYIGRLNRAKLLIIDDLGAERGTDYTLEKVYDIVDSRYRSWKPVIFTTNLTIGQMKECTDIRYSRIYDRIFEMCYPVKFEGLSWRKRGAAERFADMKKILED